MISKKDLEALLKKFHEYYNFLYEHDDKGILKYGINYANDWWNENWEDEDVLETTRAFIKRAGVGILDSDREIAAFVWSLSDLNLF